jgi:hypothetical protein
MIKINTLFKKNPNNLALIINELNPGNEWVLAGEGVATRKFDGTSAAVINGNLYKRYDVKKGRTVPANAIPCQEPDPITGHWPHWIPVDFTSNENRYFAEAWFSDNGDFEDGTYELIGPKIQGNPEKWFVHSLIRHGSIVMDCGERTFESLRDFLISNDIEGLVFHHPDGRMCKLRKSDYGLKR